MAFPTKESYLKKYGEEDGLKHWDELSQKKRHTKENCIKKYGEEEGLRRWEAYCQKHRDKCTLEGHLARGKTEEDWKSYSSSRAITKIKMIERYGEEEGLRRWEVYRKKQAKAGNTLEYFIEKYGVEIGTARYLEVNSKKGITLQNMIRVHGEIEGPLRHKDWLEATARNYVSQLQKSIINEIISIIPPGCIFHDGIFSKEFCVYSDRAYMYDFVITDPIKVCIEINGDYWHANPKLYNGNDFVNLRGGGCLASDIWEKDKTKKCLIESRGFIMYTIWESDWNQNKNLVLENVKLWTSLNQKSPL